MAELDISSGAGLRESDIGRTVSAPTNRSLRRVRTMPAVHWLLTAVLIGYPIAGLLSSALDIDSKLASIPLRVAVVILALAVISMRKPLRRSKASYWLLWFGAVYLARLLWDAGVSGVSGASEALVFYIITIVIPCYALLHSAGRLHEMAAARLLVQVGSLICVGALFLQLAGYADARSTTEASGRLSFEALNPITLGHTAVTTLIAILYLLHKRTRAMDTPFVLGGSVAALFVLALSGSRGPLICLLAAALVYAVATKKWKWLILIGAGVVLIALDPDSGLTARFLNIEEDKSSLDRLLLQAGAITAFLQSPIVGAAYIVPNLDTYPHNLFIETAMAMGLIGIGILLPMMFNLLRYSWRRIQSGQLLIPMIFTQYLLGSQISGSIGTNAALWATAVFILGTIDPRPTRKRRRRRRPHHGATAAVHRTF